MANEQTTGVPLTAPLGEQLAEKGRLEQAREAERQAGGAQVQRVEWKKVEEREAAARHAAMGMPRAMRAGDRGTGHALWPVLLGGLGLFGALVLGRRLLRR